MAIAIIQMVRGDLFIRWRQLSRLNSCRYSAKQFSNRGLSLTELEADRIFNKPELRPGLNDQLIFAGWRLKNLPHYLIRILRESLLANRVRFPRSIETYNHR
jgi:hypothetical protein